MADAPARTELKVTTGPIRGSRKIHVGPNRVAMRAVDLEPAAALPECQLCAVCGFNQDVPCLLAGLPPVELGTLVVRRKA